MINYDKPIIEVQNIQKSTLCVFSDVEEYTPYDIVVEEKINDVRHLSFKIDAKNIKCDYLINENIIEYDGNEYLIVNRTLEDSDEEQYYSIECFGIEYTLAHKYNGKFDFVGASAEEIMKAILKDSGFLFGETDTDKKRHLISEDECVLDNLISVADVFDGRLEFRTETRDNVVYRFVSLYTNTPDYGRYIEKGRDLISINIEYSTEEMANKIYVFGENDKATGQPINMIDIIGKSYVEDYSYYTDQGFALEDVKDKPQYTKELIIQNNDLTTPQQVADFAKNEIKRLAKPIITCQCTLRDLHQIKEYMTTKPKIGELVKIYDYDIGFEGEAIITGATKHHNDISSSKYDISNIISYNSSFTKSYNNAGKTINKVIASDGTISGGSIQEGSIGSAQIGDAVIENAHIGNLHADKITAGDISADRLQANTIDAINLYAGSAKIDSAKIGNLNADNITAGNISADRLQANVIDAINLNVSGEAKINGAVIADASIGSSSISSLSADKIDVGTIDLAKASIKGSDNAIEIVDGQIMVNDTSDLLKPKNRVILGKYIKNAETGEIEYGLLVRSADGETTLIDGNGVHSAGITDGSITDNKVNPDANISGSKLDIGSVITEINDNGDTVINSSKIHYDNKSLDVTFKEIEIRENQFEENISNNTSTINQHSQEIALKVSQQDYEKDKVNNTTRFEKIEGQVKVNSDNIKLKVSQTQMESYVNDSINKVVKTVDVFYAIHDNPNVAPTDGWVTELPTWETDKYIWTKTVTTFVDNTQSSTTPVCITSTSGTNGEDGRGVVSIVEQYYLSTSNTELRGGRWTNEPPVWEKNKYIWTRSVITYTDDTTHTTDAICTTGQKGEDGTSVKILGSYDSYDDLIANHPTGNNNGDGYIVQGDLWIWDGSKFNNVGKFQGKDGVDGTDGVDGVSIVWKGSFDKHPSQPQNGWAYYNTKDKKSYVYQSGAWYQMTIDGTDGQDGITYYTWIKYADDKMGSGISDNPDNKEYIGFAYNKTTSTESNNPKDYIWSLIKGTDGVAGQDGQDGKTYYTWIKYSDYEDGLDCYDIPTSNTKYIGIATNKDTPIESNNPYDYVWSKFRGDDGVNGTDGQNGISIVWKGELKNPPLNPELNWCYKDTDNGIIYIYNGSAWEIMVMDGTDGTDGANGITYYTWIRYADDINGSGISDLPDGKEFIGFAYNKTTSVESDNPKDYKWSLIKGMDGVSGVDGQDGKTYYTWIKYSDFEDGTACYDIPTETTKYIGIAVNKETSEESSNPSDYVWSKFRGDDGVDGSDGLSIFITYHDSISKPSVPTGDGTTGGWHTNATDEAVWMSQKISSSVNTGNWGNPIKIKGIDGADGISITKVDVEYGTSNSNIIPPTSWSAEPPEWRNGYYMWSRTKTYYSFGNPSTTQPVCISGSKGQNGDNGRSVKSITEEYYLSTSKTTQTGGSWSETYPEWVEGKYIWTRSKIVYINSDLSEDIGYTTPVCDGSWEAINEVGTKVDSMTDTVSQIETNLDNITSRVQSVEKKTITIEDKIVNHESRISVAEEKITEDAIISTVSGTIDQKIEQGTAGIIADINNMKHDVETAKNNAEIAKNNANKAISDLNDLASDSSLTPSEKQQVNNTWLEIMKEKSGIIKQADVYQISKTNYEYAYSDLDTYLFGSGGILVSLSNTTYGIDILEYKAKFNTYYEERQIILDTVAQKTKEYADKVKEDVEQNISDTTAEIRQSYETAIKQESDRITNEVGQYYTSKGETTSLEATLRSLIKNSYAHL